MDAGPSHDGAGDGDAIRVVHAAGWQMGVLRSDAGEFQRVSEGPRGSAGALHVPVHAGGVGPAARQCGIGFREVTEIEEAFTHMRNYFLAAGLASVLALAGCGGGEKTEAPKSAEATPAAGAGGGAAPDEANGGTIIGKVAFDGTA